MSQRPIEMILMRQLASTLAMPIFLVDAAGTLVFYNAAAEEVLGVRFDETGEMAADAWSRRWQPTTADGGPLPLGRLPLRIAIAERRAVHDAFWIAVSGAPRRHIAVTAIPLIAVSHDVVGAAAFFWETAP